ncbi:MAG TPA: HAD family hydrolase [Methylibium sp.]|uniref:HAD family hydrolase n=1 Tax=Methylibium sp. TaxID=2067992 RepID=UPI002DBA587E|nr:HAD family hydrolase [Methylibium sp.]HEU4460772.1 HAD family hydrolase [Methylibium sp.]
MPLKPERLRAITIDLDDTLWPIGPVIQRAEAALQAWLAEHAPAVALHFDRKGMLALRAQVERDLQHVAHDLTAWRKETLRRALQHAGCDAALAEPAFDVFFAERNRVEFYADALPALDRLAARWPLIALSNGNADPARIDNLAGRLSAWISAREVGVGKPDRRIFDAARVQARCEPQQVLHVGDDFALDVIGAHHAGMATAWVRRADGPVASAGVEPDWRGQDLLSLCEALRV